MKSLFQDIPETLPEELFNTLCASDNVVIERIVSRGHASPEGFWYDQGKNEFVLVVKGSAGLQMEKAADIVVLNAGDFYIIPARVRHRVAWTDSTGDTVWLAVYY